MFRCRRGVVSLILVIVLVLTGCSSGTADEKDIIIKDNVGILTEVDQELILDVEGKSKGKHVQGPADAILGESSDAERSPVVEDAFMAVVEEPVYSILSDKAGYYVNANSYVPDPDARVKIVLDPGHGGKYAGAEQDGYREQDMALKVALYCKEYLVQRYSDVAVYLTRQTDVELQSDTLAHDLEARVDVAVNADADALVSLHFNGSETHEQSGATVYVSRRDNVHDVSATFGDMILNRLADLGLGNNGISTRDSNDLFDNAGNPYDYYAINRHGAAEDLPAIIVEHCFLDNEADFEFYRTDEALRELAYADALGIAEYFELTLY